MYPIIPSSYGGGGKVGVLNIGKLVKRIKLIGHQKYRNISKLNKKISEYRQQNMKKYRIIGKNNEQYRTSGIGIIKHIGLLVKIIKISEYQQR